VPRVRVKLLPEGGERVVEVREGARVRDLLAALGLDSESHVVMAAGAPLTEDDPVPGEVTVVRVLSGG